MRDRQIPVIGVALEAARDALQRAVARSGDTSPDSVPLFASFDGTGRGADVLSTKLNAAIRVAGVPNSPRLTSYSLRHSVKEALRSADVSAHVQDRIMGHAGANAISDRYGSPRARLSETHAALESAMEFLGDVDDSIYSDAERITAS